MSKYIRTILLVLAAAVLLLLPSCAPSAPESAELHTSLNVSKGFSGSRTIQLVIPSSVIMPGSEQAENLETVIRRHCPPSLSYTTSSDSSINYIFSLSFSSFSDYNSKLTDLLGSPPTVIFSNPDTPITTGWRIQEYFQSSQLLSWISDGAKTENLSDLSLNFSEPETSVTFGTTSVKTTPTISVNCLNGSPIDSIKISTLNKKSTFDRTISFTISQSAFDSLGSDFSDYFSSVTDSSADTSWQLEQNKYIYTVSFTDITLKQLEGYTNRLLSSVYGDIDYLDKTQGSTPLAFQNSFTETLDFSNYIGSSGPDVPVEYIYSLADHSKPDQPLIYSDLEWSPADTPENSDSSSVTVTSQSPSLTVKINDGKQYVPVSIDISLTPLDGENLSKTYAFRYDIADGGTEAAEYTLSYFTSLDLLPNQYVEGGQAVCAISFSGTPAELNSKITDIFGDSNLISITSSKPFMTLRTKKQISDHTDLSSLLTGKNIDTPVNYTLLPRDGEKAEALSLQRPSDTDPTAAEPSENGIFTLSLAGTEGDLYSTVSVANWQDIIIFLLISLILILITSALIFILRSRKPRSPTLNGGESSSPPMPDPKKRRTLPDSTKKGR